MNATIGEVADNENTGAAPKEIVVVKVSEEKKEA